MTDFAVTKSSVSSDFLIQIQQKIAYELPSLENLEPNQLEEIAKLAVLDRYKNQMNHSADLLRFIYDEQKVLFIDNVTNSLRTKLTYLNAFNHFENYLNEKRIKAFDLDFAQADDFIYSLNTSLSPNSVRTIVATISSFYSFVERRSNRLIFNPFSNTKAKPKKTVTSKSKFYNVSVNQNSLGIIENDIQTIIESVKVDEFKHIIFIIKELGLRCGAIQNLSFIGDKYKTVSKGKNINGAVSEELVKYLARNGIKHCQPFAEWSQNRISTLFKYYTNKLYDNALISYRYSIHDLRHYYSLKSYLEHKDLHRLSKELNHSSVAITEQYLRGLNLIA